MQQLSGTTIILTLSKEEKQTTADPVREAGEGRKEWDEIGTKFGNSKGKKKRKLSQEKTTWLFRTICSDTPTDINFSILIIYGA